MSTTKEKAQPLDELERLEQDLNEAREKRSKESRHLKTIADQAQALLDERNRLINRDPSLVDHRGAPVGKNAVAKIDDQARELGDLGDLRDRHEHAKRIEAAAQREFNSYVEQNIVEIAEAVRPGAEAAAERVIESAVAFDAALADWTAVYQRSAGLVAPVRRLTGRDVPGMEQASGLRRQLRDFDIPAPYPRVNR